MHRLTPKPQIVFAFIAGLLGSGCMFAKPAATSTPSAFYNQMRDLVTIVERLAQENGCIAVEQRSAGEGAGSGQHGWHGDRNFTHMLRGSPENANKFMQALRTELENAVRAGGATVDEESGGHGPNKSLAGFSFDYTTGTGHGQVEASILDGGTAGAKTETQRYELHIRIQEWAR
jgi:hypothetical protein